MESYTTRKKRIRQAPLQPGPQRGPETVRCPQDRTRYLNKWQRRFRIDPEFFLFLLRIKDRHGLTDQLEIPS